MTQRKYYLAGPMSGRPGHGFPDFIKFENALRSRHWDIVSPRELTLEGEGAKLDKPWHFYMRRDLTALLQCDGIILMPGWRASRGARLECLVADKIKMEVLTVSESFIVKPTRMGDQSVR